MTRFVVLGSVLMLGAGLAAGGAWGQDRAGAVAHGMASRLAAGVATALEPHGARGSAATEARAQRALPAEDRAAQQTAMVERVRHALARPAGGAPNAPR